MLADLLRQYGDIVASWSVLDLSRDGADLRLKADVVFRDGSLLHVRQIVLDDAILKYAYHWQDGDGGLLCRWDNARHWKRLATYPSHRHLSAEDAPVEDTSGGDLSVVLAEIAAHLRRQGVTPSGGRPSLADEHRPR